MTMQTCENCTYRDMPQFCELENKEKYGFCDNHTITMDTEHKDTKQ